MDVRNFQQEEDQLLWTMLEKRFFNVWQNPTVYSDLWQNTGLELFITSDCNLKCEYCYINQFGDQLYPKEIRDRERILSNIDTIFNFIRDKDLKLSTVDVFSGEIWHTTFGIQVLRKILVHIKSGVRINQIVIPTNCSFIMKGEGFIDEMQNIIDEFSRCGTRLVISCSIEGLPLEDISRPAKDNSVRDESFYNCLFKFCKKNTYLFHPMVAASNIHKWPENYDWFESMCKKYDMLFPQSVMMLEVRNGSWDDKSLEMLNQYYKHQIDYMMETCNGNIETFVRDCLYITTSIERDTKDDPGYVNIAFSAATTQPACSISFQMTIRVGDLMVVPCHRTAYEQFNYGQLQVENGKISGIKANNTQTAAKILLSNSLASHHGCDLCTHKDVCMRGCFGEQFEETKEIFMPDPVVCKMMKSKYDFLINTYEEMGVWEYLKSIPPSNPDYIPARKTLSVIKKICSRRDEECLMNTQYH